MTTTQIDSNKQKNKSAKKKQNSPTTVNLGTPKVPSRQKPKKQQCELLGDWNHAS
jgi:hypothetical protein